MVLFDNSGRFLFLASVFGGRQHGPLMSFGRGQMGHGGDVVGSGGGCMYFTWHSVVVMGGNELVMDVDKEERK